jgi:hypothetical protein
VFLEQQSVGKNTEKLKGIILGEIILNVHRNIIREQKDSTQRNSTLKRRTTKNYGTPNPSIKIKLSLIKVSEYHASGSIIFIWIYTQEPVKHGGNLGFYPYTLRHSNTV